MMADVDNTTPAGLTPATDMPAAEEARTTVPELATDVDNEQRPAGDEIVRRLQLHLRRRGPRVLMFIGSVLFWLVVTSALPLWGWIPVWLWCIASAAIMSIGFFALVYDYPRVSWIIVSRITLGILALGLINLAIGQIHTREVTASGVYVAQDGRLQVVVPSGQVVTVPLSRVYARADAQPLGYPLEQNPAEIRTRWDGIQRKVAVVIFYHATEEKADVRAQWARPWVREKPISDLFHDDLEQIVASYRDDADAFVVRVKEELGVTVHPPADK
ncbi:MAG: hypothetical protein VE98_C0001G0521 [candidate division Kazan bacterium GW2011_GWA1_50_15]|uniref:Uncharacterized protein n=2 Tax=Bacteria division Kazan-3B-28 TaxID=1798534 RepID=A0A0G1X7P0_UNCK3|nr:MAG: hypothetical protein VE98_C0001G0521 [candidate division Kazan bacterium GW2011_GWA1_50_15]KKW25792.1 MAG: hypothetical protein VE99_C0001G0431 [candidate division Kazan bacterium GW2011_GWC1_52_13]KKW27193.1 MAG: hypothetical protein VF00_C0001G0128 [candidate division Kazan bacterium GW2011_GWB1_52_7]